jgi:hypothetical protein
MKNIQEAIVYLSSFESSQRLMSEICLPDDKVKCPYYQCETGDLSAKEANLRCAEKIHAQVSLKVRRVFEVAL